MAVDTATPLRRKARVLAELPQDRGSGVRVVLQSVRGQEILLARYNGSKFSELVVEDLDGTVLDRVPRPDPNAGVFSAVMSGDSVVWMETTTQDYGVQPWVLYSYDRSQNRLAVLARSADVRGSAPPPVPGYTGPVVVEDRVYWAQVRGVGDTEGVDIMGCALSDCQPELVLRGAAFPAFADGQLLAVSSPRYRGDRETTEFEVRSLDLATGKSRVVADLADPLGRVPSGFAASGDTAITTFASPSGGTTQIIDLATRAVVAIDGQGASFSYPFVSERLAVWADGNSGEGNGVGGYLYDLAKKKLYSVGNAAGLYTIRAAADRVAWQEETGTGNALGKIQIVVGELP